MNEYYPRKEVMPGLWVGSAKDARDHAFLKNVGLVINCSKTIPFATTVVPGYRVAVDDDPSETGHMLQYFPIVVRIIDEALNSDKQVLVHCYAGMQRSSAVAAAYLMYKLGITHEEAMQSIKRAKSESFEPHPTFAQALRHYYMFLNNRSRSR